MLPGDVRIFACAKPVDMRKSFDGLALATQGLGQDPRNGALYCFVNKRANRIKVLWWDRNGYCLLYKRLHRALFRLPTKENSATTLVIDGTQLASLLAGVSREQNRRRTLTKDA